MGILKKIEIEVLGSLFWFPIHWNTRQQSLFKNENSIIKHLVYKFVFIRINACFDAVQSPLCDLDAEILREVGNISRSIWFALHIHIDLHITWTYIYCQVQIKSRFRFSWLSYYGFWLHILKIRLPGGALTIPVGGGWWVGHQVTPNSCWGWVGLWQ